jgi:hypothetical protein
LDQEKRSQLEARLRETLKNHQREGLNMIGNVDQLLGRLMHTVEEWLEAERADRRKTA